jgi:hypothetical protein
MAQATSTASPLESTWVHRGAVPYSLMPPQDGPEVRPGHPPDDGRLAFALPQTRNRAPLTISSSVAPTTFLVSSLIGP